MSRVFAKATCGFFLLVSGLGSVGIHAATPQGSDGTAEAKQHYQNAVAAIARGDWQVAKNELLRAERLAPQNALAHYDLALAYSHAGQNKSALAELSKAVNLGLPPAQKRAAEDLRRQLITVEATPANRPAHSTAEIAGWIVNNGSINVGNGAHMAARDNVILVTSSIQLISSSDSCSLAVHTERTDYPPSGAVYWQLYDVVVPIATLDPEKIELTSQAAPDLTLYIVNLKTTNNQALLSMQYSVADRNPPQRSFRDEAAAHGYPKDGKSANVLLYFSDQELANRMITAFGDLIRQCGGKRSVGDIY